jgi:biotin carboxyl carrier protein
MKLKADIDGRTYQIELTRGDGNVTAVIDGRTVEAEISEPEPGLFLFKMDGRVVQAYAGAFRDGVSTVSVNGQDVDVRMSDPKKLRGAGNDAGAEGGRSEIKTAMPGKVVRILVEQGAEVHKGDGLIVVEAMKMQNEMKSVKNGVVSEIRVAEGDLVGAGDVLLVVE